MNEKLKPCPFCGKEIDIEKNMYIPERDWHPTYFDPDSGGDPISICCKCGLEFSHGYDWDEFVKAWNRRSKESPLPVEYEADGYDDNGELIYDTAYCPNCRNEYEVYYDYHDNYCRKCGQKLDWRTDNG